MPPKKRSGGGQDDGPAKKKTSGSTNAGTRRPIRPKSWHLGIIEQMRDKVPDLTKAGTADIALAHVPSDDLVYFWLYFPTTNSKPNLPAAPWGTPYPPSAALVPYTRNAILLQRIQIRYSLDRRERSLLDWQDALRPFLTGVTVGYLWLRHSSVNRETWLQYSEQQKIDDLFQVLRNMNLTDAVQELRGTPDQHPSFIKKLDEIVQGSGSHVPPLPDLQLWNNVYAAIAEQGGEARRALDLARVDDRYGDLRIALSARTPERRLDDLDSAYGKWGLRHLLMHLTSYDDEPFAERHTMVLSARRAATLVAKCVLSCVVIKDIRLDKTLEEIDRRLISEASAAGTANIISTNAFANSMELHSDGKWRQKNNQPRKVRTQVRQRIGHAVDRIGTATTTEERKEQKQQLRLQEGVRAPEMKKCYCKVCGIEGTWVNTTNRDPGVTAARGCSITWSNLALDAVEARSHGNTYDKNTQWLCVACNHLKRAWDMEHARKQAAIIAGTAAAPVENDLMVAPRPPQQRQLSQAQKDACLRQAKANARSMEKAIEKDDWKAGNVTQDFIQKKLEEQISGEKSFICAASGAEFPLCDASVDRINSKRGYDEDNIRIVAWVFNALKSNTCHDKQGAAWTAHLRSKRAALEAAAKSPSSHARSTSSSSPPAAHQASPSIALPHASPPAQLPSAPPTHIPSPWSAPPPNRSRRRTRRRSTPPPLRRHPTIFFEIAPTDKDGHCGFHAIAEQLGITWQQVRDRMLAWAEAHLAPGPLLDLHRSVLQRPVGTTAAQWARGASQPQWLVTDLLQTAANAFNIVILEEDVTMALPHRVAYRPEGTDGDTQPIVGLSHEPGHWEIGVVADDVDLPPFLDELDD